MNDQFLQGVIFDWNRSGASEKDDSDEKEILINDRERLRNPFF